ncbi:MAG: RecQ family ATP-dependent DNA helicase [Defluviitaleaceae bacterium]|nr:RecQ family ATP-dependent DNA helicase [Defluviitaleaceae bacterium]
MTIHEILKKYFGYDGFRTGQEELICDILAGKDVLGIMPTGAGKSMCFQIPALVLDGLTIVVSPLISLMKDQVNALTQSGVGAAYINSSLSEGQIAKALTNARNGEYKLVYVAPERLTTYDFISFAKSTNVSMLTVDEAHCISQWGQDFRPSYAKIPEFVAQLDRRPVVSAFTATATPVVRDDILAQLKLSDPTILVSGFDRHNLYFDVKKPQDRFDALMEFLRDIAIAPLNGPVRAENRERSNAFLATDETDLKYDCYKTQRSGIVYCSTRANVEDVCLKLQQNNFAASRYHAGLSDAERRGNQDDFLYDRVQIMVATNAFGMGIDKSNVSFVVHYNMPMNLEAYYQEAGRAGRDGSPADCLLLYSGQDVHTNLWMIDNSRDVEYKDYASEAILKERDRKRLREMTFYCATRDCLRGYILKYFGEKPQNYCGNCSNCNTHFETEEITQDAQKIVSCVARMKERYGLVMLIDVLRGSKNEKVLRSGLDKLSTYGICKKTESHLRDIVNHLLLTGALIKTDDEYPIIKLGPHAADVLRGEEAIYMKLSKAIPLKEKTQPKEKKQRKDKASQKPKPYLEKSAAKAIDKKLFEQLKELRLAIATEQKVPAFVILHDSSLTDMCHKLPKTLDELLRVSGIGQVKAEKFGQRFIDAIAEYN